MADIKTVVAATAREEAQSRPATGLFGFAGTTLFQPGQPLFKAENNVPHPKAEAADGEANRGD